MNKTYKRYMPFFLSPVLICFVLVFIIPFVYGIVLSFFNNWSTSLDYADMNFIGFNNYVLAFRDKGFLLALRNTALFSIVSIISINLISFGIALLLTRGKRFSNVFRTVFFMPNLIGGIILGLVWQLIINGILQSFLGNSVKITDNSWFGFWGLVILMNWQLIGYMTIIYIAGIGGINHDLIEQAEIDGAGAFHRLIHIIVPSVMPAVTICLFLTLTNTFKLYDQNYALTQGLPIDTQTGIYTSGLLAFDIVHSFKSPGDKFYPIAQAKAVIFFILVGIISSVQVFLTRRKEIEV